METIGKYDASLGSLTLQHLRLLREVGRSESWTEAGDVLGLAQSTVSQSLSRVEAIAGVPLFERHGVRRVPTPAGRELIDLAGRMLADAERSWDAIRARDGRGTLRVGTIDAVMLYLARDEVRAFVDDHPAVDVRMVVAGSGRLVELLDARELDVAVLVGPEPNHAATPVAEETLRIYGRHGDERRCVLYPDESRTRRLIDVGLAGRGIDADVMATAGDPAVLRELAALGVGWTVLPVAVAEAEGVEPPTPRGPIVAERPIVAIRRQAGADPLVERFVETLVGRQS
jgi:LysR family nitrogen assimilation transcriptional regulator